MSRERGAEAKLSTTPFAAAVVNYRGAASAAQFWFPFHFVEPVVFIADFVLVVGFSILTGVGYHWLFLDHVPDITPYIAIGALTFSNFAAILAVRGAYRFRYLANFKVQALDVTFTWTGVFLFLLGIAFSLRIEQALSRGATFGFFALGLTSLLIWRGILAHWLSKALHNGAFAERKVLVIGESQRILSSSALQELLRYGYRPVKIIEMQDSNTGEGITKKLEEAIKLARKEAVQDIFLMIPWEYTRCIDGILEELSVLPVPVYLIPDDTVARYLGRRVFHLGEILTAELKRTPLTRVEQTLKRAVDIIGASIALIMLFPLMVMTAILIKIDSRGPVFFKQKRNGFNGRSFRIWKFRTMSVLEDGLVIRQATREDPRFTRVGRWLRRVNIDELPQLFNVLTGNMSLVGPRPHAAAHDSEYERKIAAYAFRYNMKPGITGWAQINGYRGETQTVDLMAKRIELDLWYINNWSIWLDLKIILSTLTLEMWQSRGY
jgi:Undecaprenyl-phosphate glucose phosphotransferase